MDADKKKAFFALPKKKTLIKWLIAAVLLYIFAFWQNKFLTVSEYTYSSQRVPAAFDGFRILQISDLHNDYFGKNQSWLVGKTKKCEPDIIVVTGDLIHSKNPDVESAMQYIRQAVEIAPVYFVGGNHERRVPSEYALLLSEMEACGVYILNNKSEKLERNGVEILISGTDGTADTDFPEEDSDSSEEGIFSVFLSHYPEDFPTNSKLPVDIIFSGHAHGGQFRLPFVGGIYAPGQGLFPEYDSGSFEENGTTMYVSRGVGNSSLPLRLFNFPELVLVTLESVG